MARTRDDGKQGNGHRRDKPRDRALTLVRVEPLTGHAINLVFESEGEERAWRLENTSVMEFLALLLRGRMQRGGRLMLPDAEVSLEPPETKGKNPTLCMVMGSLELCAAMDRAGAGALKADIERAFKRPS